MRKINLITRNGRTELTEAYYVRQGLAVTRVLESRTRWHVTHLASSMSLDYSFSQRQRAKAYQDALLALDIDWTQSDGALRTIPDLETRMRDLLDALPR